MPCYSPLTGWRGRGGVLVFKVADACGFKQVVSCGQCIGCRLERSRQWGIRISHEAQLHDENSFITLTYSPECMPQGGTLVKSHFQDFMKRLRARLSPKRVRFFHCGEYGDKFSRPHYHACLFGFDFPDRVLFSESNGVRLYSSEFLTSCWDRGFCTVGDLTFQSACYVARYCLKKVTGERSHDHYWSVDEITGELCAVLPEYCTMSRGGRAGGGGIGAGWFKKFSSDVYPWDEVITNGFPSKPPRFYDGLFEIQDPSEFERVKRKRVLRSRRHLQDQTPARLAVREQVKLAQVSFLKRGYEDES